MAYKRDKDVVDRGHEISGRWSVLGGTNRGNSVTAHVLLVSPDGNHRRTLASVLADAGLQVSACEHGREAVRLIGSDIDLVVADIVMPDVDGLELLRHARTHNPALPVILISSGLDEIDRVYLRYARLFGAAETFGRPVQAEAFLEGVAHALRGESVPPVALSDI